MTILPRIALLATSSLLYTVTFELIHNPIVEGLHLGSASRASSLPSSKRLLTTSSFLPTSLSESASSSNLAPLSVIGGPARSRPSCVAWGNGRADCVYAGIDGEIFQQTIKNRNFSKPISTGGVAFKDVQCVTTGADMFECVSTDIYNNLMTASWTGHNWTTWQVRTGDRLNEVGRDSCTSRGNGMFNCVVRIEMDHPAVFGIDNGVFSGFSRRSGTYHSPFSCVSRDNEAIDCYALCYQNKMCTIRWRPGHGWGKNGYVDDIVGTSTPSSIASSETRNHVFGTSTDNKMIHVGFNEGEGFSPAETVGELAIIESPECVAYGSGKLYCFALGFDHFLYKTNYDGSSWSDWELLGGAFLESPSCVLYDTDQIYCFARSFRSSLVQIVYNI